MHADRAVSFACGGHRLTGVLTTPVHAAEVGVIVIVGGPQYRAGSHRQFVLMARSLAQAGVATLRFDVRGMGDSEGEPQGFERQADDIDAAIACLRQSVASVRRVVLFGLCDGASSALLHQYERARPRVDALILLNPWVRSVQTQARTQIKHYYTQRLRDPAFWRKLLQGGVAASALGGLLGSLRTMLAPPRTAQGGPAERACISYQARMADAWHRHAGPLLLMMSANDYTAREFDEALKHQACWRQAAKHPRLTRCDLAGADHTLSAPDSMHLAHQALAQWLQRELVSVAHG